MKIDVDVKSLKDLMPFEYLEVFQLDSLDTPVTYTEHPVPADVALPRGMPYEVVSRLVNMRFAQAPQKRDAVYMPKRDFPRNWNFDVIVVGISGKKIPILLVFYSRDFSTIHLDAHGRPWAAAPSHHEEQIEQRLSAATRADDNGGMPRPPKGQDTSGPSSMVRLDMTTFEQLVFVSRRRTNR